MVGVGVRELIAFGVWRREVVSLEDGERWAWVVMAVVVSLSLVADPWCFLKSKVCDYMLVCVWRSWLVFEYIRSGVLCSSDLVSETEKARD